MGPPAGAEERGFVVNAMLSHPDGKLLDRLAQAVAEGKLVIPIAKKLPLAQVRQAQELAQQGGVGKVILTI